MAGRKKRLVKAAPARPIAWRVRTKTELEVADRCRRLLGQVCDAEYQREGLRDAEGVLVSAENHPRRPIIETFRMTANAILDKGVPTAAVGAVMLEAMGDGTWFDFAKAGKGFTALLRLSLWAQRMSPKESVAGEDEEAEAMRRLAEAD